MAYLVQPMTEMKVEGGGWDGVCITEITYPCNSAICYSFIQFLKHCIFSCYYAGF